MLNKITYRSEITEEYRKELDNCNSLNDLKKVLKKYKPIAFDAWQKVNEMSEEGFIAFKKGLAKERRGIFSGDFDVLPTIMLPGTMLKISIVAHRFKVPWGCAYHRMKDAGQLIINPDGLVDITIDGEKNCK